MVDTIALDQAIASYGVNAAYQPRFVAGLATPIAGAVTARDPTAADDLGYGYAVNDRWYNPVTAKLWKCTSASAGAAVWVDITPTALPYDALVAAGGAAQGVYGVRKMRAAYAGACLRVRRDADKVEADIGFDAAGMLDVVALAAFLGPIVVPYVSPALGSISRWYDQSGNANDAIAPTESSTAQWPRIHLEQTAGGAPTLLFGSFADPVDRANTYLTLPAGITGNQTSATIAMGVRAGSVTRVCNFGQIGTTGGAASAALFSTGAFASYYAVAGRSQTQITSPRLPMVNAVTAGFIAGSGAGASSTIYDGTVTTGTMSGTTAQTGGYIGATGTAAASRGACEIFFGVFASTAWTSAQWDAHNDAAILLYRLTPQVRDVLALDGDSFVDGQMASASRNPGRIMEAGLLSRPYRVYNLGTSGDRLDPITASAGRINKYPATAAVCFNGAVNAKNVFVSQAATNDVAWVVPWSPGATATAGLYYYNPANGLTYLCTTGGVCGFDTGPTGTGSGIASGAAVFAYTATPMADVIYGRISTLINLAKATGYQKTAVVTTMKSKDLDFRDKLRDAVITRQRNNGANADRVIDPAGDILLSDYRRTDLFHSDAQHMRDGGMNRWARIAAYQINSLG